MFENLTPQKTTPEQVFDAYLDLIKETGVWLSALGTAARLYALYQVAYVVEDMQTAIKGAQSPIEQLMGICLFHRAQRLQGNPSCGLEFTPQGEVKCEGRVYHVDFLLSAFTDRGEILVAVECDGHEFHERSKEQAARDKARDRAIQTAGVAVLRFTGSEIWADPQKCANQAITTLLTLVNKTEQDQ